LAIKEVVCKLLKDRFNLLLSEITQLIVKYPDKIIVHEDDQVLIVDILEAIINEDIKSIHMNKEEAERALSIIEYLNCKDSLTYQCACENMVNKENDKEGYFNYECSRR
jgi:hypothetical protein